jgi:hypothetical protein
LGGDIIKQLAAGSKKKDRVEFIFGDVYKWTPDTVISDTGRRGVMVAATAYTKDEPTGPLFKPPLPISL